MDNSYSPNPTPPKSKRKHPKSSKENAPPPNPNSQLSPAATAKIKCPLPPRPPSSNPLKRKLLTENLHKNPISRASDSGVKIWKQKLIQMGAKIEAQLSDKVTHVFAISSDALLHSVNEDQLARFKGISRKKMSCFHCFNPRSKDSRIDIDNGSRTTSRHSADSSGSLFISLFLITFPYNLAYLLTCSSFVTSFARRRKAILEEHKKESDQGHGSKGNGVRSFIPGETTTRNFRETNLLGEGGFGVFKDYQEFIVEVLLSLLHHVNLVTLIGYCTAGDQRLLVYDIPMGSLEDHLFEF
ncbi:Detected protein of unknown function [Hibiscus syriacus]|uniref:Protein kinase domain-containing protein n=1 Tax=Hibiscus syriacus TaxID=106335 RepID=A0A6A3AWF6_HIBSY|nr:Detected protein of unknown function [Hibiscus syriacus]